MSSTNRGNSPAPKNILRIQQPKLGWSNDTRSPLILTSGFGSSNSLLHHKARHKELSPEDIEGRERLIAVLQRRAAMLEEEIVEIEDAKRKGSMQKKKSIVFGDNMFKFDVSGVSPVAATAFTRSPEIRSVGPQVFGQSNVSSNPEMRPRLHALFSAIMAHDISTIKEIVRGNSPPMPYSRSGNFSPCVSPMSPTSTDSMGRRPRTSSRYSSAFGEVVEPSSPGSPSHRRELSRDTCDANSNASTAGDSEVVPLANQLLRLTDNNGATALHVAAMCGNAEIATFLLENGSQLVFRDRQGQTPQDVANSHGNKEVETVIRAAAEDAFLSIADEHTLDRISVSYHGFLGDTPEAKLRSEEKQMPSKFSSLDEHGLIVCMVGLPGRGKSYISRRICRFLNWSGVLCRVFNAGDYRRRLLGASETSNADFYDPSNREAGVMREKMAMLVCEDIQKFLGENPKGVAIMDATNTTMKRRNWVLDYFNDKKIVFVETICSDFEAIQTNILRSKFGNDDYKKITDIGKVFDDFNDRISQYEKVYEPLSPELESETPFIKLRNMKSQVVLNKIRGGLPTMISSFLLNLHPVAQSLFLVPVGETVADVMQTFGGKDELTEEGQAYSDAVAKWLRARKLNRVGGVGSAKNPDLEDVTAEKHFDPTSSLAASYQSDSSGVPSPHDSDSTINRNKRGVVVLFDSSSPGALAIVDRLALAAPVKEFVAYDTALAGMNYGEATGMTRAEFKEAYPKMYLRLVEKKRIDGNTTTDATPEDCYLLRYPGGESAFAVNHRLESVILDASRRSQSVVIIAPSAPIKGLYSFFTDSAPERALLIDLPEGTIFEIPPKAGEKPVLHRIYHRPNITYS